MPDLTNRQRSFLESRDPGLVGRFGQMNEEQQRVVQEEISATLAEQDLQKPSLTALPDRQGPESFQSHGGVDRPFIESDSLAARNLRAGANIAGALVGGRLGVPPGAVRAARSATTEMMGEFVAQSAATRNSPIFQRLAQFGGDQAAATKMSSEVLGANLRLLGGSFLGQQGGQTAADLVISQRIARGQAVFDDQLPTTLQEGIRRTQTDAAMEAILPGFGLLSKTAQRIFFQKLARIPASNVLAAERALSEGVQPGLGEFSNIPGVGLFRNTIGQFPFVNPVTRKFELKRFTQMLNFKNRLIDSISPQNIGRTRASTAMMQRAPIIHAQATVEEARRWSLFRAAAEQSDARIPTAGHIPERAQQLLAQLGRGRVRMEVITPGKLVPTGVMDAGGKPVMEMTEVTRELVPIPPALVGRARKLLTQMTQIEPSVDFEQWQGMMESLNDLQTLSRQHLGAGRELRLIKEVQNGFEDALEQIEPGSVTSLASGLSAVQLRSLLLDARNFTRSSRELFETATGRRFQQGIRRLFKPGLKEERRATDEMFEVLFRNKSPKSLQQLRTVLQNSDLPQPDKLFRAAVRTHISDTFEGAFETVQGTRFFDLNKLQTQLGIGSKVPTPERLGFIEMLRGSGVDIADYDRLFKVATDAFPERLINVSTFLGRRTVLGSVRGAIGGFFPTLSGAGTGAAAVMSPQRAALGAVVFFWASRAGARFVADPAFLKSAIRLGAERPSGLLGGVAGESIPAETRALVARMGRITGGVFTDWLAQLEVEMSQRSINAGRPGGLEPIFSGEQEEGRGTRTNQQRRRRGARQRRPESRTSQRSQSTRSPRPGRGFNRPVNPGPPRTGESHINEGAALPPSSPLAGTL